MKRRLLRRIHRWAGLLMVLPIAVQGMTGTILAVAELIPEQRTTMAAPRPANDLVTVAERWVGVGSHATRYFPPSAIGHAARVEVAVRGEPVNVLRIDPATLSVLDATPSDSGLLNLLRSLHLRFLGVVNGGRAITGWFGVGLLIMLITAVPIWWPSKRGFKPALLPDLRTSGILFHRRLHGAAGGWIILVLAVLTISGIAMAFPDSVRGILGLPIRNAPSAPIGHEAPAAAVDVDRALELAGQAVPGSMPRVVVLPAGTGTPIRIMLGRLGAGGAVDSAQVQVDTAAGRIISIDTRSGRPSADTFYRWLHDLHTGNGIGVWWRILAAAAGLSLPLLAFTGAMSWWRRNFGWRGIAQLSGKLPIPWR
jgi:uncharacterized iron-regulated membrane protein